MKQQGDQSWEDRLLPGLLLAGLLIESLSICSPLGISLLLDYVEFASVNSHNRTYCILSGPDNRHFGIVGT